ncbi:MAG: hypothetical protein ACYCVL_06380 [Gemmatimonadaceae bacterium]|nr:hypothetical protein [Gemmatimonadaceae bacterium]
MASFKVEQRRIVYRGRQFHFVSYDATPANERRGETAVPAMWYLMNEGKRYLAIPHRKEQDPEELDRELVLWLGREIFDAADEADRARLH